MKLFENQRRQRARLVGIGSNIPYYSRFDDACLGYVYCHAILQNASAPSCVKCGLCQSLWHWRPGCEMQMLVKSPQRPPA